MALNKAFSNVYNCRTMGPWFSGRTVLSHGTSGGPIPLGSNKIGGLHGHLFLLSHLVGIGALRYEDSPANCPKQGRSIDRTTGRSMGFRLAPS